MIPKGKARSGFGERSGVSERTEYHNGRHVRARSQVEIEEQKEMYD
jgi:hypothetical protein